MMTSAEIHCTIRTNQLVHLILSGIAQALILSIFIAYMYMYDLQCC